MESRIPQKGFELDDRNLVRIREIDDCDFPNPGGPTSDARVRADRYHDVVSDLRGKMHQALDGEDLEAAVSECRDFWGVEVDADRE